MAEFGGRAEALRSGDVDSRVAPYLVPYNDVKAKVSSGSEASFRSAWEEALSSSEKDFREARRALWCALFEAVGETDVARGGHPGLALQVFVDVVDDETARGLLRRMMRVHRAATTNSEGLRKLVKKYDDHHHQNDQDEEKKEGPTSLLSVELLPTLYTSSLYAGRQTLWDGANLLRELLAGKEKKDGGSFAHENAFGYDDTDVEQNLRAEEFDWLERLARSYCDDSPSILPSLVAHRGFHCADDRASRRPLENSLDAYETAWTKGVELCECDVAVTKDGVLVLARDETFSRLALDARGPRSGRRVSDSTFRELMDLPLKSGRRPSLLVDVLRSASVASSRSRLIVEIKPGDGPATAALARILTRFPDLRASVAAVTSHDASTLRALRTSLRTKTTSDDCDSDPLREFTTTTTTTTSSFGAFDHFGVGSTRGTANADERLPQLLLLAVAYPPKTPCEKRVRVSDLSRVDDWLRGGDDGDLDGVYLEYEPAMRTEEGAAALRALSERCTVGIWQTAGRDPDDHETASWLVNKGGCSFVNTDLPRDFRKGI